MTETVDSNPELSALLWENALSATAEGGKKLDAAMKEISDEHREVVTTLFAAFFARHPYVEAIAFSNTSAEYDDEGYGGYEFVEMRPRFHKDKCPADVQQWLEENTSEYSRYYVEQYYYSGYGNKVPRPDFINDVMKDVNDLEMALRGTGDLLSRMLFGEEGVKVTAESLTTFHGGDDDY